MRFTVLSSGLPLSLSGCTFKFRICSGYTNDTLLVESNNSEFKSGDWVNYSASGGKICCRLDMGQSEVATYLAGAASKNAHCTLWAEIGSIDYVLAEFNANIKNTILP